MRRRRIAIFLAVFLVMILLITSYAMTASNTVPVTALMDYKATISGLGIPPECSGFNIVMGTSGDDNNLQGQSGRDNCIFGFEGNDTITAGNGNKINIIFGGPGIDYCKSGNKGTFIFHDCEYIDGVKQ